MFIAYKSLLVEEVMQCILLFQLVVLFLFVDSNNLYFMVFPIVIKDCWVMYKLFLLVSSKCYSA